MSERPRRAEVYTAWPLLSNQQHLQVRLTMFSLNTDSAKVLKANLKVDAKQNLEDVMNVQNCSAILSNIGDLYGFHPLPLKQFLSHAMLNKTHASNLILLRPECWEFVVQCVTIFTHVCDRDHCLCAHVFALQVGALSSTHYSSHNSFTQEVNSGLRSHVHSELTNNTTD